jgi:RNA polymerase sigma-B factor
MQRTRPPHLDAYEKVHARPLPPAGRLPESDIRRSFQDVLVLDNVNLARSIAARYSFPTHDLEDIRQVAYMGLIKASRSFDKSKGTSFPAYAAPTIAGEVKRYLRDHCWVVRPPRSVQDIRQQVRDRTAELTQQLRRAPTQKEVAADLGIELCQVDEALAAAGSKRPDSLDTPGAEGGAGLSDHLPIQDCPTDRLEDVLALRCAIRTLSDRDRHLLYPRYYQEETQQGIADALGMSQMQVSRKLAKILVSVQQQLLTDEAETRRSPRAPGGHGI